MRGDVLATVCGREDHRLMTCPRWCDAGAIAAKGAGADHQAPATANGSSTVPWVNLVRVPSKQVVRVQETVPSQVMPGVRVPADDDTTRANAQLDLQARDGIRALLRLMGEDPTRPGLQDTPARVVRAYLELADQPGDPAVLLGKVFQDVNSQDSEMIAVPGIPFVSLCEHHLLPFTGTATVAYIPNGGGVVGLSKLPRLFHHYARRPQVQERLTTQVVDALVEHLDPLGAAVLVRSTHACMALRGVRAEASMVTSALRGRFLENPATRAEFMTLATGGS